MIFVGEMFAILNCLCVPSPQSIKMFSFLYERRMELWLRFLVGIALLVPKNNKDMFSMKRVVKSCLNTL